MDSRLKLISPSSICLLHSCPRKYQLTRLWPDLEREDSVHTIYGKMFHTGIQELLTHGDLQLALLRAATEWKYDLYEFLKEKSFFHCWQAIERFSFLYPETPLVDYEVLSYNGKPAVELGFCIELPNKFYYRGYIDLVMQHKHDGSILVVDLKTSGAKYSNPAKYQNSAQNIAYSVVLDAIAPGLQTFNVMYYEFLTGLEKYVAHDFIIDNMERATWIRDLLMECDIMSFYDNHEDWPKHGESCAGYGSVCTFINNCTMPTSMLLGTSIIEDDPIEIDTKAPYDIMITLDDIINGQLELLEE